MELTNLDLTEILSRRLTICYNIKGISSLEKMNEFGECQVCGNPLHHPLASHCRRCKKFIDRVDIRRKPDKEARARALKQAWDGEMFRCYYSGAKLVEDDPKDPRYLTFDHRIPRQEHDIVVVAQAINDMKSDMADDEFRGMVLQLASRFTGGKFDERAFHLKHWRR